MAHPVCLIIDTVPPALISMQTEKHGTEAARKICKMESIFICILKAIAIYALSIKLTFLSHLVQVKSENNKYNYYNAVCLYVCVHY